MDENQYRRKVKELQNRIADLERQLQAPKDAEGDLAEKYKKLKGELQGKNMKIGNLEKRIKSLEGKQCRT
jgi:chromosome segregation ATPase